MRIDEIISYLQAMREKYGNFKVGILEGKKSFVIEKNNNGWYRKDADLDDKDVIYFEWGGYSTCMSTSEESDPVDLEICETTS